MEKSGVYYITFLEALENHDGGNNLGHVYGDDQAAGMAHGMSTCDPGKGDRGWLHCIILALGAVCHCSLSVHAV